MLISFLLNRYQICLIICSFIVALNYFHKLSIIFIVLKNSINLSFFEQIYIIYCIIQTYSRVDLY